MKKLKKYMSYKGHTFNIKNSADIRLCFIESQLDNFNDIPTITRLDGIYFNTAQNYKLQNTNILRTYNSSKGIIFQSNFNKNLIEIPDSERQDLKPVAYIRNGSIYASRRNLLIKEKRYGTKNSLPYIMNENNSENNFLLIFWYFYSSNLRSPCFYC